MYDDDEDDDEAMLDDREAPDASDRIDEPATFPCPYCKRQLHEDSVRCPYCGAYLSKEDAPRSMQWTWVVGVVVLIAIILSWLMKL